MASTSAPSLQARRHDIVHLRASCLSHEEAGLSELDRAQVRAWILARHPFVARRQDTSTVERGRICLGLPLPPSLGKRRIALDVGSADVLTRAPPPLLRECLQRLPTLWCESFTRLDAAARDAGVVFRVFGSVAFESLTGLTYLHPASDVDLLWSPADRRTLEAGVRLLAAWERSSGMRADGEIVFADHGVAWREFSGASARLLVKSSEGPALLSREELVALLDEPLVPEPSAA